jgi:hypothetical protein
MEFSPYPGPPSQIALEEEYDYEDGEGEPIPVVNANVARPISDMDFIPEPICSRCPMGPIDPRGPSDATFGPKNPHQWRLYHRVAHPQGARRSPSTNHMIFVNGKFVSLCYRCSFVAHGSEQLVEGTRNCRTPMDPPGE